MPVDGTAFISAHYIGSQRRSIPVVNLSRASLSTHTDEDVSAGVPVIEEVG